MLQAYLYIAKMKLLTNLTYRFEWLTSIFTNLILMLASVFIWQAAYRGGGGAGEALSVDDMVTYSILSSTLGALFVCNVQDTIYVKMREGQIATDLYRPLPLLGGYLADDIGGMLSSILNNAIPLFLFAALFFGFPGPADPLSLALFIPSCLLSYGILWLLSALVGMVAFWVMELGNMGMVKDVILRVLSGAFVPIWFFPGPVQTVSAFLPFQYTYQTPLGIYIGRVGTYEALGDMAVQAVWIALLALLLAAVWRRAKTKTLIQGG
ncbi:ABC transporter permease [Cohnella sp. JJ-181]|uniref:ABC transporter permease n=1 Tax=Cohnella rhizoplanae TaxID=2974897 RepID=UPI0022FF4FBB|nr:ABC-2 family transporter protein [Cohnella sp. JJ-181]CAI6085689.1 hypothetical protein COHCIP112018_04756 [Cohnella sp. JJ-181]